MNERIQEIALQATETFTTYFDGRGNVTETYFDKEKFAELIVRECADVILQWKSEPFPLDPDFAAKAIKQHFGVE